MPLSVCIPVLNRSRTKAGPLLPNCLESVRNYAPPGTEVVLADFGSTDWPPHLWAAEALGKVPLEIVDVDGPFSRGRGLNRAAEAASHDALLFLDADMLVCAEIFRYAEELSAAGAAYFPICWSLGNRGGTYGWWRKEGWGNCAMSKQTWQRVGGWWGRERWGKEDVEMRDALKELGVPIVRGHVEGFVHQWHPKRM